MMRNAVSLQAGIGANSIDSQPQTGMLRFSVKSLVRKACMGLALVAVVRVALLHSRAVRLEMLKEAQHDRCPHQFPRYEKNVICAQSFMHDTSMPSHVLLFLCSLSLFLGTLPLVNWKLPIGTLLQVDPCGCVR